MLISSTKQLEACFAYIDSLSILFSDYAMATIHIQ